MFGSTCVTCGGVLKTSGAGGVAGAGGDEGPDGVGVPGAVAREGGSIVARSGESGAGKDCAEASIRDGGSAGGSTGTGTEASTGTGAGAATACATGGTTGAAELLLDADALPTSSTYFCMCIGGMWFGSFPYFEASYWRPGHGSKLHKCTRVVRPGPNLFVEHSSSLAQPVFPFALVVTRPKARYHSQVQIAPSSSRVLKVSAATASAPVLPMPRERAHLLLKN